MLDEYLGYLWCVSINLLLSEQFGSRRREKKLQATIRWCENRSSNEQLHFLNWLLNGETQLYVRSSTVQFLLMVGLSKPIPGCRSCGKEVCKGFPEAWKTMVGRPRKRKREELSPLLAEGVSGRGSGGTTSWWWSFLHSCGRESWQIFSVRKVEVTTYVVCVLFVWDCAWL